MKKLIVSFVIITSLFLVTATYYTVVSAQTKPFTIEQILRAITLINESQGKEKKSLYAKILSDVKQRKVDFLFTKDTETLLSNQGATKVFIEIIRENSLSLPTNSTKPNSTPISTPPLVIPQSKAISIRNSSFYLKRADNYFGNGKYELAIQDYTQAIALNPSLVNAYNNRAIAYDSLKNYDLEIADYTKVIELDPKSFNAYYNRGITYTIIKDYDRAIADYSKAIELNSKTIYIYHNRALLYSMKNDYDGAISDYSKLIELDSTSATNYSNRASVYFDKRDYTRAIADYTKAIELNPIDTYYFNRGGAYYKHLSKSNQVS